jgi:hypothetical protein
VVACPELVHKPAPMPLVHAYPRPVGGLPSSQHLTAGKVNGRPDRGQAPGAARSSRQSATDRPLGPLAEGLAEGTAQAGAPWADRPAVDLSWQTIISSYPLGHVCKTGAPLPITGRSRTRRTWRRPRAAVPCEYNLLPWSGRA